MINGTHALIYVEDAETTRAFFRDVLQLPNVDARDGWLIFRLPPAELGIHPVDPAEQRSGAHQLSLMCDDIEGTVDTLKEKGVRFTSPIEDQGFGLVTTMVVPGGAELMLYEPRHPVAYNLEG
jgi:catechol 2,3-dioxygenase-like lactoylglutathione lyase family enzyme